MCYREVVKALHEAGWYEVRSKGSHHQFKKAGIGYVVTVPDHGAKDIHVKTLGKIEKATGLSLRR